MYTAIASHLETTRLFKTEQSQKEGRLVSSPENYLKLTAIPTHSLNVHFLPTPDSEARSQKMPQECPNEIPPDDRLVQGSYFLWNSPQSLVQGILHTAMWLESGFRQFSS